MVSLYKPFMPAELPELETILHSGALAYGKWGKEFEAKLRAYVGTEQLMTTNTFAMAIQIALTVLDLKPGDEVMVNGQRIRLARNNVYLALNKPVGITCTTEKNVKGNIVDLVNHPLRVFNIGRLDKDSDGLILLTNDGDIVNEILRAENNHEK